VAIDITEENSLSLIPNIAEGGKLMQAYCVKCKAKKEMKNAKAITMKNGKPATQGVCPTCGTKMFRIQKHI
jgi:NAD-dependent SIR2 family protein deacetylase